MVMLIMARMPVAHAPPVTHIPAPPMAAIILPLLSGGVMSMNIDWKAGLMKVFGIVDAANRITT